MNKRGGVFDIILILIITFVGFLFFAGIMYAFNNMTTQVVGLTSLNPLGSNVSDAGVKTFGAINTSLSALRWIAFLMVIAMFIGLLVSNFLVKAHPVFFIIYILIVVVAIVFSVHLSNAYESILASGNVLAPTLASFTGMNWIMLNLPIWITVIGIGGAIMLFIGIIVDREAGGNVPI